MENRGNSEGYRADDIVTIEVTPDMKRVAVEDAFFFRQNFGAKTVTGFKDDWMEVLREGKKVRVFKHDIVGSLAHQSAELAIESLLSIFPFSRAYTPMREKKLSLGKGDEGDLELMGTLVDVKGSLRDWDDRWFYNQDCSIYRTQWDRKLSTGKIGAFLFVSVDKGWEACRVLGLISVEDFRASMIPSGLNGERLSVKSRYLTGLKRHLLRA